MVTCKVVVMLFSSTTSYETFYWSHSIGPTYMFKLRLAGRHSFSTGTAVKNLAVILLLYAKIFNGVGMTAGAAAKAAREAIKLSIQPTTRSVLS